MDGYRGVFELTIHSYFGVDELLAVRHVLKIRSTVQLGFPRRTIG